MFLQTRNKHNKIETYFEVFVAKDKDDMAKCFMITKPKGQNTRSIEQRRKTKLPLL